MPKNSLVDLAWEKLLADNASLLAECRMGEICHISTQTIKEYRSPRLMTHHPTSCLVPKPLKNESLNILPTSRVDYVMGTFKVFEPLPNLLHTRASFVPMVEYETLVPEEITSVENAVNAMVASRLLGDFLKEPDLARTISGRMGTGRFSFSVDTADGRSHVIDVDGSQVSIDAGFENESTVVILKARNVIDDDFNVGQLYYPFKKLQCYVTKPIRLVFSQYTNMNYYLHEYRFKDASRMSSIELVQSQVFTLDDQRISPSELWSIFEDTQVEYEDYANDVRTPFIQADRFDRVISLLEYLSRSGPDWTEIDAVTTYMGTTRRQAQYYTAAGVYLELFERKLGKVRISDTGQHIARARYRDRQLMLARQLFKHRVFHNLFALSYDVGSIPEPRDIVPKLIELKVCNQGDASTTVTRRASTVASWMRWLMSVPDQDD